MATRVSSDEWMSENRRGSVACRGVKCLHQESSSEGWYALRALVYLALAGKRATADRIRVQKAIPEYLEGKGNGLFCGVCLWLAGDWSIGIRRLGKIVQGSALSPRYAARMEGRVCPGLVGDQRRRACCRR
jgi:hypothetical protein